MKNRMRFSKLMSLCVWKEKSIFFLWCYTCFPLGRVPNRREYMSQELSIDWRGHKFIQQTEYLILILFVFSNISSEEKMLCKFCCFIYLILRVSSFCTHMCYMSLLFLLFISFRKVFHACRKFLRMKSICNEDFLVWAQLSE